MEKLENNMDIKKREDLFNTENKIAEEYDLLKLAIPHHDEFQAQVSVELSKEFTQESEPKILELGSGTGLTTMEIIKSIPGGTISSVDLEDGMVQQAKEKNIPENVEFIVQDALEYLKNSQENTFDSVVTGYTLHNFENDFRNQILEEVYRVLKPGGLFINADKFALDDEIEYKKIYDEQISMYDVYDALGKSDLKKEWVEHYAVDDKENIRLVEGIFKNKLKEIGFSSVETTYREMLEAVVTAKK